MADHDEPGATPGQQTGEQGDPEPKRKPRRRDKRRTRFKIGPRSTNLAGRVDGRSEPGRFLRGVKRALAEHLGGALTPPQALLVDAAALMSLRIALMSERVASAEPLGAGNDEKFLSWANSLSRILEKLGIKDETGGLGAMMGAGGVLIAPPGMNPGKWNAAALAQQRAALMASQMSDAQLERLIAELKAEIGEGAAEGVSNVGDVARARIEHRLKQMAVNAQEAPAPAEPAGAPLIDATATPTADTPDTPGPIQAPPQPAAEPVPAQAPDPAAPQAPAEPAKPPATVTPLRPRSYLSTIHGEPYHGGDLRDWLSRG